MNELHEMRFPNESDDYRNARNELLQAEIDLRKNIEHIAKLRRALPTGGRLKEDYLFEEWRASSAGLESATLIRLSELFANNKNNLVIYSFMYGPDMAEPCPACTSILDGLNGAALHIRERVNFVVVAKSPILRIRQWAHTRNWTHLRLLSSSPNSYNADYFAETANGDQLPALNVFIKSQEGIFHSYNTELLYAPAEIDQDPRHADSLWPVWNLLDLTPEGRGKDWYPQLSY